MGATNMDGSWFWQHPIDAQLDWDLENEEASLTPWVLCHEGVQLICNSHFPFGFAALLCTFLLGLLQCYPVVRFAFGFPAVLCSLPFGFLHCCALSFCVC